MKIKDGAVATGETEGVGVGERVHDIKHGLDESAADAGGVAAGFAEEGDGKDLLAEGGRGGVAGGEDRRVDGLIGFEKSELAVLSAAEKGCGDAAEIFRGDADFEVFDPFLGK